MSSPRTCHQCGARLGAEDRFCPQCGTGQRDTAGAPTASTPASPWEAVLERLRVVAAPRYRVLGMLGYGGMAAVFLAEEPRLGRRVAIKVMAPGLMMDPALVSRFQQEARTIAQLHHPNIVTIFDVDERDGLHYFVMAFVPGRTLAQVMAGRAEPLPVRAVMHWLMQAGGALAYAHRAGVVHRDIKPGNILLDSEGNAQLVDFGIAKVADEPGLTRTGVLVGTPAYMSPEQCAGGAVGGASDQYSLGVVAYEMLTGGPPFTGATMAVLHAHVHERPRPVRELRPECPEPLAAVVERMLAKTPEERFPDLPAALAAAGAQPLAPGDPLRAELAAMAALPAREAAPAPSIGPDSQVEIMPAREPLAPGEWVDVQVRVDGQESGELRRSLVWRTSDPSIATVTGEGRVRALRPGSVTITASAGDRTISTRLTVTSPGAAVGLATPPPAAPADAQDHGLEPPPADAAGEPAGATALFESDPSLPGRTTAPGTSPRTTPGATPSTTPGGGAGVGRGRGAGGGATLAPPGRPGAGTDWTVGEGVGGTAAPPSHSGAGAETAGGGAAGGVPGTAAPRAEDVSASHAPAAGGGVGGAAPSPGPGVAGWWRGRRGLLIGGGLAGTAALVAALVLLTGGGPQEPAGAGAQQAGVGQPGDVVQEREGGAGAVPDTQTAAPGPVAAADTGATAQAEPPAGGGTDPATDAEPPPPAPGRILILGDLPTGTRVTVSGAGIGTRRVSGASISLPPGTYMLEATAPGHEAARTTIDVGAGQSVGWSPTLQAAAQPEPSEPPPGDLAPPPAREDTAAAPAAATPEAQVRGVIEAFVAAFQARDMDALVRQYPGAGGQWERTWRPFVENTRDVRNLRVRLASVSELTVSGTSARAAFSLALLYDDFRNERRTPTVNLAARLRRSGDGWVLAELTQVQ